MLEESKLSQGALPDRDVLILRGLFESRIMTIHHVAALFFGGRKEAAKKRVQKLKAARLVVERPRKSTEPSILFLGKRGYDRLLEENQVGDYPALSSSQMAKRVTAAGIAVEYGRKEIEEFLIANHNPRFCSKGQRGCKVKSAMPVT